MLREKAIAMNSDNLYKLVAVTVISLLSFSARAAPITYTDFYDPAPDIYMGWGATAKYSHNINDDGYDALLDDILSVMLNVDLDDDGDSDSSYTRRYTSWCGRHSRFGSYHCHYSYRVIPGQTEYASITADHDVLGSYEIDYSDIGLSIDPFALLDGILDVAVAVTSGDAWFRDSTLTVVVDRAVSARAMSAVPVPAPLALMVIGLLGMRLTRRRGRSS